MGSHQHERSEEVNDFQKAVDGRLSPHQEEIVMAKPMPRFVKARILVVTGAVANTSMRINPGSVLRYTICDSNFRRGAV